MTKLAQALEQGQFAVMLELDPPRGIDLKPFTDLASNLAAKAHALVVTDNRGAVPRLSPLAAGLHLMGKGLPVLLTLACRDRNRLAMTSDLLAAAALGLTDVLLVSGTFPTLGDHPQAKPVYDLDSIQALQLAVTLAQGRDLAGHELAGAPSFLLGASAHPQADPQAPHMMKARKKIQAGAAFLITSPLTDLAALKALTQALADAPVKLIAGLEVKDPGQRDQVAALAKEIKGQGLAAGVHLACPAAPESLPELLAACGF
jgi:methylenetetrahydrofolate reductase (NADPH)